MQTKAAAFAQSFLNRVIGASRRRPNGIPQQATPEKLVWHGPGLYKLSCLELAPDCFCSFSAAVALDENDKAVSKNTALKELIF